MKYVSHMDCKDIINGSNFNWLFPLCMPLFYQVFERFVNICLMTVWKGKEGFFFVGLLSEMIVWIFWRKLLLANQFYMRIRNNANITF